MNFDCAFIFFCLFPSFFLAQPLNSSSIILALNFENEQEGEDMDVIYYCEVHFIREHWMESR
jgi:hypothetical protein